MMNGFHKIIFLALVCLFVNSLALADESADLRSLEAAHQSFSNLATALDADAFGKVLADKVLFHSHNTLVPIFLPTRDAAVDFFSNVIFRFKEKGVFSFNSRFANFTVSGNTGIVSGIRQIENDPRGGYLRFTEVWARGDGKWELTTYNETAAWGPAGKLENLARRPPGGPEGK